MKKNIIFKFLFVLAFFQFSCFSVFSQENHNNQKDLFNNQSTSDWLNQLEPLYDLEIFVEPNDGHQKMIDAINQATTSIHMIIFHISDEKMIDALIQAKKRNVDVSIIMDQSSLKNPSSQKVYDTFSNAGINVVKSSKGFSITHIKSFTVDKKVIFITTMNFIKMYFGMRDYGISTTNINFINEFESVFEQDLANANLGKEKITPSLNVANLIWSPVNSQSKLSELINRSNKNVELTVESLSDASVVASLGNAAKRGVQVRIITPECMLGSDPYHNERSLKILVDAGVDSRMMPYPQSIDHPYMHAKTIVSDNKYVFLGSENFSINSLLFAREFGVVTDNEKLIQAVKDTFELDWSHSEKFLSFSAGHCDKKMNLPFND